FLVVCNVFMCFFFFFQAEDGIRDRNVTGVQTCALPILFFFFDDRGRAFLNSPRSKSSTPGTWESEGRRDDQERSRMAFGPAADRSEERRVGKECRRRRGQDGNKERKEDKERETIEEYSI